MQEFLTGFEERMKLAAIVASLTNRKGALNRNIEDSFDENDIDNLLVMVLVYFMDCTLRYNQNSALSGVARFLSEAVPLLGKTYEDYDQLASYLVNDILQNKGEVRTFRFFDSTNGNIKEDYQFRLLDSAENERHQTVYQLTNEAYNFLFRSKEIDSELDFSVERFKLKEFVRRHNYSKALEQSRELIARVREQKVRIQHFLNRCRENIAQVTISEYEAVAKSTQALLNEEYEELSLIKKDVQDAERKVRQDIDSGDQTETALRSQSEITHILYNLDVTLDEQKSLINRRYSLSGLYEELLQEQARIFHTKRFRLDEEILKPMERLGPLPLSCYSQLTAPLFLPRPKRLLNLLTYYARQQKLREEEEGTEITVEYTENAREQKAQRRNERFEQILRSLFDFFCSQPEDARISGFFYTLSPEMLRFFCEENALLHVILELYATGEVNYGQWRKNPRKRVIQPRGEFDLSYLLSVLEPDYHRILTFAVSKRDEQIFSVNLPGDVERPIEMTDFYLEVSLDES